ncbi:MAG: MBL fold metallo-hydrolase [Phycisphaeraceae bacterium]
MDQISLFTLAPAVATTSATPAPAPTQAPPARNQPSEIINHPSAPPTLRVCVLGSGSGGNSTVAHLPATAGLTTPRRSILLDAGFGPRTTARRLAQARVSLDDIHAICLTHLDRDHFRPSWIPVLLRDRIDLHLHRWHLPELACLPAADRLLDAGLVHTFDEGPFHPLPHVVAHPFRCQHDRQGTIAYRLEVGRDAKAPPFQVGLQDRDGTPPGRTLALGYATDLGHVPPGLVRHLAGVDVLAIEANYDHWMTVTSSRPTFVNRRNLSDSGHLSNEQALAAVRAIDALSPHANPRHVLLMHRSSQCNHPTKLRRVFDAEPTLARRVRLTEQRRRTGWVTVRPLPAMRGRQMTLAAPPR